MSDLTTEEGGTSHIPKRNYTLVAFVQDFTDLIWYWKCKRRRTLAPSFDFEADCSNCWTHGYVIFPVQATWPSLGFFKARLVWLSALYCI